MIVATQRPRELTRRELKRLALLLDAKGFSEASLRRADGSASTATSPRTSSASSAKSRAATNSISAQASWRRRVD
ncbi:MAG TPA: hypothetical protein VG758_12705 [Hyphomicrobiaceae bacterium]|jgi:type I restriction enzyme R subunit|nr:hypothetical protein [Hyphomicrobiaceae bacterium]